MPCFWELAAAFRRVSSFRTLRELFSPLMRLRQVLGTFFFFNLSVKKKEEEEESKEKRGTELLA